MDSWALSGLMREINEKMKRARDRTRNAAYKKAADRIGEEIRKLKARRNFRGRLETIEILERIKRDFHKKPRKRGK